MPGHSDRIERIAADWLARIDADTLDAGEREALDAWLDADPAHRVAYLRLHAAWAQGARLDALGAGLRKAGPPARGHWRTPSWEPAPDADDPASQAPDLRGLVFAQRPPHAPRRFAMPAIAAVLLLATTGMLGWGWHHLPVVDAAEYRTALGDVSTVPLADGSQTTLASDSHIDVRLSRRERHIDLHQGEAFFEAASDPARPFVVAAGERRVVAVGTRFSVRRDGPDLRVVVTEGSVRLESLPGTHGAAGPTALLPAGSVALARRDGVLVRSLPLDEAARMVDWRSGLLVFRDSPLAEAAAEFNRYNTRKIVIADDAVGQMRIGGSFRWENAEGFVRLLEQGFPLRAEYGHDHIVLHAL